ncbi:hypothetical protein [uncultured Paracoccus sp.]|uniref:hypothetical protein n=1 Tax=uncultured Paracoccus sp. TaxID=189685 RepID=UPI00260422D4|nr:hypothetical protein [uncultured Paracoccus sp.]
MDGGPGAIRTPDPQIRSLTAAVESKGKILQPAVNCVVSNQSVTKSVQTETGSENKNPSALAGATGVDVQSVTLFDYVTLTRLQAASALAGAIAACDSEDRIPFLELLLQELRPGWPQVPFLCELVEEAGFWADRASRAELKAYCLSCYQRMRPDDQAAFLAYVHQGRRRDGLS